MNVLILTPDAVGSTLLQRLITIYMNFHEFDRPVINLHELTNGLEKYYSPEFGREIVSKRRVENWGYYQTLEQVVELLSSADHYKTSRLAQYHIKNRGDSLEQQIPFYQYLSANFFVIACRRHNIFEHALSMTINRVTGKLNVYDHGEKINTFLHMYQDGIDIDLTVLEDTLQDYQHYIEWSRDYFAPASYFYYDDVHQIEQYILGLPMFKGQPKITWQHKFGIDFNDWNRCHHIPSDMTLLCDNKPTVIGTSGQQALVSYYQQHSPLEWPPVNCYQDFETLPVDKKNSFLVKYQNRYQERNSVFMQKHQHAYTKASSAIERMQELDMLQGPPPIKKQTLYEKMQIVKNLDQCVDKFNQWICRYPDLGMPLSLQDLENQAHQEQMFWQNLELKNVASPDPPSIAQS